MIWFLAVGFLLMLLLVIATVSRQGKHAPQQTQPEPEPAVLDGAAKRGLTLDSAEVADKVAKAVRVREATYAALRKKKGRSKDSAGYAQDPAVPPGQRVVKKYANPPPSTL
jgi:ABC-type Fe3+-hydroxamate transport system substrate-binding protein